MWKGQAGLMFNVRFSMLAQVGWFHPNELIHFFLSCAHSAMRFKLWRSLWHTRTHPVSFCACLYSLAPPPKSFCKWTPSHLCLFVRESKLQTISVNTSHNICHLPHPKAHSNQHVIFCSWDSHHTFISHAPFFPRAGCPLSSLAKFLQPYISTLWIQAL